MRNRRAMSLLELLIAIVIMGVVMGAAMNFFIGQSKSFRRGASDVTLLQNLRFGADLLNQHFRSVGANTTSGQPPIIYADANTFSFNADYATIADSDHFAIYYTPNAPAGETVAIRFADQITIPGTGAVVYPTGDYLAAPGVMSPAEMITFWFAPDTETTRSDDYVLFRQVNNSAPEAVVRNVLKDTVPFFRYLFLNDSANLKIMDTVQAGDLPLVYSDSVPLKIWHLKGLRAVIVSYIVTNGLSGPAERTRPMSLVAPFPNLADHELQTCGNDPVAMTAPTITTTDSISVDVAWTADGDETSGERDIMNYLLWRRPVGDTVWQAPFFSMPAGTPPNYTYHDSSIPQSPDSVVHWEYAVAAQDCTPSYSGAVRSVGSVPIKKAP